MDRERFLAAVEKCSGKQRDIKGIGTLGERSVHATLKAYFEPQADNTEIKIGSFVADIAGENGIIEIQTRALYRLRKKLDCFLEYTHVTVVYPVIAKKYIPFDLIVSFSPIIYQNHYKFYIELNTNFSIGEFIKKILI